MLNLIQDPWLPVVRADGLRERIAPWQLTEIKNPVLDLDAPRADFQGGLYQWLIGLLQMSLAPEEVDDWAELWDQPPSPQQLKHQLSAFSSAFELEQVGGPAFLQDFDLREGEEKPIAALLIEAPGDNTIKNNQDLFIKRDRVECLCPSCTATTLFVMQSSAPSGGAGHRVGLRGGGPLTTLVRPWQPEATLWQKLWLNIIVEEPRLAAVSKPQSTILPWLAPTRESDEKNGGRATYAEDVHPLQMYWGMPRRFRLLPATKKVCSCSVCGAVERVYCSFITRNYGVNYDGPWVHPLTPYRHDPKKKNIPLSLKGQRGGIGYQHWLGLTLADSSNGDAAAKVIAQYSQLTEEIDVPPAVRIWSFGFDMDNMKARCWYEQQMPLFKFDSDTQRENLIANVELLLSAARDGVKLLRQQVKAAWFSRTKEVKGDLSVVEQAFWEQTESAFYQQLQQLVAYPEQKRLSLEGQGSWQKLVCGQVRKLFDQWTLSAAEEDQNLKRIMAARALLNKKLASSKSLKTAKQQEVA